MTCTRDPFSSRGEALAFLRKGAYPNKVTGQMPIRAYKCPRCRKWHVTSKPQGKRNK